MIEWRCLLLYIYKKENIKIIGYKTGKVEVFKSNEDNKFFLISELFDHNDEINHINYNERLLSFFLKLTLFDFLI